MAVCNHSKSVPEARITHKRGEWNDTIAKKLKDGDIFFDISGKKGIWTGVQDLESGKVLAAQVAVSPGELRDVTVEISAEIADIQADITGIKKSIDNKGSKAIRIAYGTQSSLVDAAIAEYNADPAKTLILINYNGIRIPAIVSDTYNPFIVAYVPEGVNQRKLLYQDGAWSDSIIVHGDTVRYNTQSLSDTQKSTARMNIGAVSERDMSTYVDKKISESTPIELVKDKLPSDFTQEEINALDPDKLYVLKDGNLYTVVIGADGVKSLKQVGNDGGVWNIVE